MSTASPLPNERLTSSVTTARRLVTTPIRAIAFWTAILVPLAYPALMIGGLHGNQAALLGLALAINVAALVLGHDHRAN